MQLYSKHRVGVLNNSAVELQILSITFKDAETLMEDYVPASEKKR